MSLASLSFYSAPSAQKRKPAFFQVSNAHGQIVNPELFRRVIRIDPIHLGYWMSLCGLILSHEPIREPQHDREYGAGVLRCSGNRYRRSFGLCAPRRSMNIECFVTVAQSRSKEND